MKQAHIIRRLLIGFGCFFHILMVAPEAKVVKENIEEAKKLKEEKRKKRTAAEKKASIKVPVPSTTVDTKSKPETVTLTMTHTVTEKTVIRSVKKEKKVTTVSPHISVITTATLAPESLAMTPTATIAQVVIAETIKPSITSLITTQTLTPSVTTTVTAKPMMSAVISPLIPSMTATATMAPSIISTPTEAPDASISVPVSTTMAMAPSTSLTTTSTAVSVTKEIVMSPSLMGTAATLTFTSTVTSKISTPANISVPIPIQTGAGAASSITVGTPPLVTGNFQTENTGTLTTLPGLGAVVLNLTPTSTQVAGDNLVLKTITGPGGLQTVQAVWEQAPKFYNIKPPVYRSCHRNNGFASLFVGDSCSLSVPQINAAYSGIASVAVDVGEGIVEISEDIAEGIVTAAEEIGKAVEEIAEDIVEAFEQLFACLEVVGLGTAWVARQAAYYVAYGALEAAKGLQELDPRLIGLRAELAGIQVSIGAMQAGEFITEGVLNAVQIVMLVVSYIDKAIAEIIFKAFNIESISVFVGLGENTVTEKFQLPEFTMKGYIFGQSFSIKINLSDIANVAKFVWRELRDFFGDLF